MTYLARSVVGASFRKLICILTCSSRKLINSFCADIASSSAAISYDEKQNAKLNNMFCLYIYSNTLGYQLKMHTNIFAA
jgi:hypothetical protein